MRLLFAFACAAALAACSQPSSALTGAAQIEHGRYLVQQVAGCNDCHTPMTQTGEPDMTRSLQGQPLPLQLVPALQGKIPWADVAPPIAGLPPHFTDEQMATFLQTGERPDGSRPRPPMPPYRFNESDARAVVAYIKTLPRAPEQAAP